MSSHYRHIANQQQAEKEADHIADGFGACAADLDKLRRELWETDEAELGRLLAAHLNKAEKIAILMEYVPGEVETDLHKGEDDESEAQACARIGEE